jgi:hypothetical protein
VSLTNVVNLNGGLQSQQSTQQTQSSSSGSTAGTSLPLATSPSALPQDSFTPSSQTVSSASTAQAAGLFSAPKTSAPPSSSTAVSSQSTTSSTAEIAAPSNSSSSSRREATRTPARRAERADRARVRRPFRRRKTRLRRQPQTPRTRRRIQRRPHLRPRPLRAASRNRLSSTAQQRACRARTQLRRHPANRSTGKRDQRFQPDRVYEPGVSIGGTGAKRHVAKRVRAECTSGGRRIGDGRFVDFNGCYFGCVAKFVDLLAFGFEWAKFLPTQHAAIRTGSGSSRRLGRSSDAKEFGGIGLSTFFLRMDL